MENKYTYSLLRYKHSALLGESLNVGLLIYFDNDDRFHFIFNNRLSRLKNIYQHFPEKTVKNYLREIKSKVSIVNSKFDNFYKLEIDRSFDSFISNYFLPYDGSALQFSNSTFNFQYSKENKAILKYLSDIYLFEQSQVKKDKEYELAKTFYRKVKNYVNEVGKSNSPNFYKDYKVKNKTGIEFNFKYAWQNGSLNLVKPLNFDLSEPRYVANKAHLTYGLLVDLEDVAISKNLSYDLLLGVPTKKDLFREYDHSKKLLSQLNRINLVEENSIDTYTQRLIKSISKG
ncbi:hypothetical protein BWZ20_02135 [Winogradskyella sp. J14-2]|uniref:hypothetical protein n=1 Tax=Winogradskyella sp. J14-2 TaxID=1936080 RepID=UPI000972C94A|nr:hypothetical protein [Winogradskyella sp. J14-2]APY07174.1 hypothetical protein BWZ20_02135 [Winogradskyella sp. J14-2]